MLERRHTVLLSADQQLLYHRYSIMTHPTATILTLHVIMVRYLDSYLGTVFRSCVCVAYVIFRDIVTCMLALSETIITVHMTKPDHSILWTIFGCTVHMRTCLGSAVDSLRWQGHPGTRSVNVMDFLVGSSRCPLLVITLSARLLIFIYSTYW